MSQVERINFTISTYFFTSAESLLLIITNLVDEIMTQITYK